MEDFTIMYYNMEFGLPFVINVKDLFNLDDYIIYTYSILL